MTISGPINKIHDEIDKYLPVEQECLTRRASINHEWLLEDPE
jgi:hypothetical protein